MIGTLAISGYRSLRELVLPLGRLNLVTGANGSGKSSLYRALRLLGDAAQNSVVAALAREEGCLPRYGQVRKRLAGRFAAAIMRLSRQFGRNPSV